MSTPASPNLILPPAPADNRFRLLLVQDDIDAARLILGLLGRTGFECFHSSNSETALGIIEELKPHLLIVQNLGERVDGAALSRAVRENSAIPILMFGPNEESVEVTAFKIGADDYMNSPLRPAILMARVVASLRRAYRYNAAPVPVSVPVVAKPENPFGLDFGLEMEETENEGFLPSRWARCDTCGFEGPRPEFEKEDFLGDLKMRCPRCNSTEHIVISLD